MIFNKFINVTTFLILSVSVLRADAKQQKLRGRKLVSDGDTNDVNCKNGNLAITSSSSLGINCETTLPVLPPPTNSTGKIEQREIVVTVNNVNRTIFVSTPPGQTDMSHAFLWYFSANGMTGFENNPPSKWDKCNSTEGCGTGAVLEYIANDFPVIVSRPIADDIKDIKYPDDTYWLADGIWNNKKASDGGGFTNACQNSRGWLDANQNLGCARNSEDGPNNQMGNDEESFLEKAMEAIYNEPSLLINEASKVVVAGYSAGGSMASRTMQLFPQNDNLPNIAAAVMIDSGSYQCYAHQKFTLSDDIEMITSEFGNCTDPIKIGCCPDIYTEKYYMGEENGMNHPPTLVTQTRDDSWADNRAADKYYSTLRQFKGEGMKMYLEGSSVHGLMPEQQPMVAYFMKQYLEKGSME